MYMYMYSVLLSVALECLVAPGSTEDCPFIVHVQVAQYVSYTVAISHHLFLYSEEEGNGDQRLREMVEQLEERNRELEEELELERERGGGGIHT